MFAVTYQEKHKDSLAKWQALLGRWETEMTSLSYTEDLFVEENFNQLSGPEKQSLFFNFHQIHSEFLVFFEQCLMYSASFLRRKLSDSDKPNLIHFAREEFYHTKSYRKYLTTEINFPYPKAKFILKSNLWFLWLYMWILKNEPLAILIPGAKSEIYFLQYLKFILIPLKDSNSFYQKMNEMHSSDEVHHIKFDFELLNDQLAKRTILGQIKFWVSTTALIIFNQFLVIISFWSMVKYSLPARSRFFQLKVYLRYCYHQVRGPAYQKTRNQLRAIYLKQNKLVFWFLRYSTW